MSSREYYPCGIKKILLLLIVCLASGGLFAQTIVYVNKNSTAVNPTGTSWATAYSDLRQALITTNTISGAVQVWVAQGIYYPTTVSGGASRFTSFTVSKSSLGIYGGFQGNETALNQRNPKLYVTRLSGNIGSNSLRTDNSHSVVVVTGYVTNTVLDGLTITDGYDDAGSSQGGNQGGGIDISDYCAITIRNCIIRDNYAAGTGGGIYSQYGTNTIENCILDNNTAASGGGIRLSYSNKDRILNCLFTNDTANTAGGGIYASQGEFEVINSTFTKNHSNPTSSPSLLHGSAFAFLYGSSGSLYKFYNCIIWNNTPFNNNQVAVNSFGRASHNLFQGTGFGTNTITGDPKFTNESLDDYTISSSCSPAVDAGTVLGLSSDLLGNTRLRGRTTDLGCYEFGLGSSASVTTPIYCEGGNGVISVATPLDIINTNILNTTLGVNINTTLTTSTVASGIYQVSILEDGCTFPYFLGNVTVSSPPALSLAASLTHVNCPNLSTGVVLVSTVSGGFAGSSLRVNLGGANVTVPATFAGLAAQNYAIQVVDITRGCSKSFPVTITQPGSGVSILSRTSTNTSCFGIADGRISFVPTGGSLPYSYSISGVNVPSTLVSGLSSGIKNILVRDAGGCTATSSVTIQEPAAVSVNVLKINHLSCGSLGSVVLTATGGNLSPSFTYSVLGINYSPVYTINTVSGLNAGTISIMASDFMGCTGSVSGITLTTPSSLNATVVGTNNLCAGTSLASITVSGSGGTQPYEYRRNGGSFQSSQFFTNLAAGNNSIEVKDLNGCLVTKSIQLIDPQPLVVQSTSKAPTCFGLLDGAITLTVTGGTGNRNATVSGVAIVNSGTVTGLASGNYTMTIRDANNCTVPSNATVPAISPLTVVGTVNNITCFNATDGKFTLVASGSNGSYSYKFNAGNFISSNTIGGLSAGSVVGIVRDILGCTATVTSAISGPSSLLTASISSMTPILCKGQSSGVVALQASGGSGNYLYTVGQQAFGTVNTITGLSVGLQSFKVKDGNGCTVNVDTTITEPATALSITATVVGQSEIMAMATGGTGNYQFILGNGAPQTSPNFVGLSVGNYTIKAMDQNGCEAIVSVSINPINSLEINDLESGGIFPNPSMGTCRIKSAKNSEVLIYNVAGQLVYEGTTFGGETQIVLKEKGMYTVLLRNAVETKRAKLIVE